ncbi:hypothetical protein Tco_0877811 [Tanacetum coccineum]|uniref:Transposase, Ptta/En/Spm, transposase, Tnp1/En/Spm-like protein n=1 Tax=Tanacetum coccineum TaxID=301880 RepID=A0ABQ5BW42_9ASTR
MASMANTTTLRNRYYENDHQEDSKIVKAKVERKSIALKAKKESSDEECSTSSSEDEEYVMAIRDFKKFFKRRDAAIRIILLENVQNHRKIRTKELFSEALGAIAVKKMMRRSKMKNETFSSASIEETRLKDVASSFAAAAEEKKKKAMCFSNLTKDWSK